MKAWRKMAGVVLAIGLVAGATGCSSNGAAAEQQKSTLTVGVQEPFSAYHIEVGVAQGFFREVGIDEVETRVFTSVPSMLTAVGKGQIEAGIQGIPSVWNYNQSTGGSKLKIFSNKAFNTTHWAVGKKFTDAVTQGSYQEIVKAWEGKRIGVPVLSGLVYNDLRYMLTQAGLNPDKDVEIIAVGSGEPAATALKKGLVDVLGTSATALALVDTQGIGTPVMEGVETPSTGSITTAWFTSEAQLGENPEFYKKIAEGVAKSKQFILDPANKDAVVKVLTEKMGLTEDVALRLYEIDRPGWDDPLNRETFERSIKSLTRSGSLPGAAPSYEDVIAGDIAR
ncbi:ABC transporter substrate-binding protein [Arthrobacter sp. GCM10027362]|uniref:ABC transporter substrate-binding protein n=1 Tax=Arthrobacter sp. GCM10027362 TaxID=3273379 RepID=UPI0036266484